MSDALRMRIATLLFGLPIAALLFRTHSNPADAGHTKRDVRGWTVHVENTLADDADGKRALELLDAKLFDVERAVPEEALAKLRRVPIWVSKDDAVAPCMCYHPSPEWLKEHGFDPQKAKGVEITNAKRFVEWSAQQPWMVLHELAHAYHDRELGYDHAGVHAAYERAQSAGALERVLHWDGTRVKAYALENDKEFFAEASEAWFGTNDFWPFVRAEVLESDAELARLLKAVWGG